MIITFPDIDPVAFSIGPLTIHWYGLAYLAGYLSILQLGKWRITHEHQFFGQAFWSDAMYYSMIGVIIGGRFGYMLIYQWQMFIKHPISILYIWQGGMSFHGGLIGVLIAIYLHCRKHAHPMLELSDFIAPMVPIGLGLGRLANFINGELWGRPTHQTWGMIFPQVDALPRYPSQLFEMLGEGIILFAILWPLREKFRRRGNASMAFLLGYGLIRFFIEYFREPDAQMHWLTVPFTMGQCLSLLMIFSSILWFCCQWFLNDIRKKL